MGQGRKGKVYWLGVLVYFFQAAVVWADPIPNCPAGSQNIPVINRQILEWKFKKPNQFQSRGHVHGRIVKVLKGTNSHQHFVIQIGPNVIPQSMCKSDTLEVVYNKDFGPIPTSALKLNAKVLACGDFIVSKAPAGRYAASPACAIIHWVHKNNRNTGHDDGFVAVEDKVYGI